MNEGNIINVNMAAMHTARAPFHLRTILGSCIGVFFYEPRMKLGGMAHILLPDKPQDQRSFNAAKYADSGVPALLELMLSEGALKRNLICKICGGAKMFAGFSANTISDIGSRNQAAVICALDGLGIRTHAKDLGGSTGRKIVADLETGLIKITHFNVGEKII
ncbi:MAG: hypothetical protein A2008_01125 [Candidatus Wallbacteria bacterium GWC2_49_35]|uniref:Probable chemoreceptor glutamine deamidase CheD n=1 Tax=Candidatus Wallbacteria bacterium GWC2_49_35 TaxID=1817813 RepID=A0A1F7WT46_9BACT|nr:MAG: hypothetical protein A2008_01125 [Candidatus Wallbacteria bacterium GWC2_49_35]HBC75330.1 chemotaxis protein CheD [Candidatus Wallbacteria bacterium]